MLMPKKTKFRKVHRGTRKGRSKGARTVEFGEYGLQAVSPGSLTAAQIESVRVTLSRRLKKVGKYFIRAFPYKPYTKKPNETRMGKGKGNPDHWEMVVKRERIVFEISGLNDRESRKLLKSAGYKLPFKTRVVKREDQSVSGD